MVLKGGDGEHEVTVVECGCGEHEESLRISIWKYPDVPEAILTVTRPKVGLLRYLGDYFNSKFWVELVLGEAEIEGLIQALQEALEAVRKESCKAEGEVEE